MPARRRDQPAGPTTEGRLLIVGPPSDLREEILRTAATTGLPAEAIDTAALTAAIWAAASLVVVDAGCAGQVAAEVLPRRPGVLIVSSTSPDADLWSAAVAIGVEQVVELPAGQDWLANQLADAAGGAADIGVLVAVVGGCGGAGASTLAVALAVSAARSGQQPVLIGADPWDGGIDVTLGAEDVPGPRWPDLAGVSGRLSSEAILNGLPAAHGVRFVSSARTQRSEVPLPALAAVVRAARRTGGPVIVDLPRGQRESARWIAGLIDLGLVVCPATVSAALATRALVAEIGWTTRSSGIVVRSGFGRDIDHAALTAAVGLPVLLDVGEDQHLAKQRQRGEPPGPTRRSRLAKSCAAVWQMAADRQETAA